MTSQNPVFMSVKTHQRGLEVVEVGVIKCVWFYISSLLCHWWDWRALSFKGNLFWFVWGFLFSCKSLEVLSWGLAGTESRLPWANKSVCVSGMPVNFHRSQDGQEIRGFLSWWKCWSVALCSEKVCQSLANHRHFPVTSTLSELKIKEIWGLKV